MQIPFHFEGISPNPSSLKLGDSGHIPVYIFYEFSHMPLLGSFHSFFLYIQIEIFGFPIDTIKKKKNFNYGI